MRILRNPYFNGAVTSVVSLAYAAIFLVTSGHMEFLRLLSHGQTLRSGFWNGWSAFLRQGNLKYVGYVYLAAAVCILLICVLRKRNYDEYQAGILTASFAAAGLVLLLLFPAALLTVLSDPNYAVEAVMLLAVDHWSVFLLADSLCVIKWSRG